MQQQEKFISLQKVPCPYPDCKGIVVFGKNYCNTCRRRILVCPQCSQRMLAAEKPFCDNCGYDGTNLVDASAEEGSALEGIETGVGGDIAEASPPPEQAADEPVPFEQAPASELPPSTEQQLVEAPPVVETPPVMEAAPALPPSPESLYTANLDSKDVGEVIADSYRQAALGTLNMHRVVDILEGLRKLAADFPDPYELLDKIDTQVGLAKGEDLRGLVIAFRTLFEQSLAQKNIGQLHSLFDTDPQAGWQRLVGIYAEALNNWRIWLCLRLNQLEFPLPAGTEPDFEMMQRGAHYASIDEWDKTGDLFLFLANKAATSPPVTAGNLVTAAEVQYLRFDRYAQAEILLAKAGMISPTDSRVLTGRARYFLALGEKENLAKAHAFADQTIQLHPHEPSGYAILGEIYLAENNLEQAEVWYRKAIEVDPGQTSGYDGLFSLYERAELLPQKKDLFPQLIADMAAVSSDRTTEYSSYTRVGQAMSRLGDDQKAMEWYQRAIAFDPSRPVAYLHAGNLFLDQADYKQAEKYYRLGIDTDPDLYTGYWNLGWMYELESKWQEARREYKKCIARQPEKEAEFRTKVGEMNQKLGDIQAAIREYLKALKIDPGYTASLNDLHSLVDEMMKSEQERPEALKILNEVKAIQGEDYEFTYQNRSGNIEYYAEKYPEAIEHYQQALSISPQDAVVWGNLGRALRGAGEWQKSREAFSKAFAIDSNQKDFDWETGTTLNEEANQYYSQGNYRHAVELYAQAVKHMPEDDVVNSNLAGAWEWIIALEPENRLAAIENAYQPMSKAAQLRPEREDYRWRLEKLRLQKLLAENYGEDALDRDPLLKPISISISTNLMEFVVVPQDANRTLSPRMSDQTESARTRFMDRWGVTLPAVNYRELSGDFDQGYYEIHLKEQFLAQGYLPLDQRFCPQATSDLDSIGVKGDWEAGPPGTGIAGYWIKSPDWEAVQAAGFPLWDIMEYPLYHLEGQIAWFMDELIDLQSVSSFGEGIEGFAEISASPELQAGFMSVLRSLARDGVSLKPLPALVHGFLDSRKQSLDLLQTAERLRSLPEVRPALPGNQGEWSYYQLPGLEKDLKTWMENGGAQGLLVMPYQTWNQRFAQLSTWITDLKGAVIVVEAAELRPLMSSWLRMIDGDLTVLSRAEMNADRVGTIQKIDTQGT